MVFRFDLYRSPRALLVFLGGISALGLGLMFLFGVLLPSVSLLGILFGAVGVFLLKVTKKQKNSRIITHDEGISGITGTGETISIPWKMVTYSAYYTLGKSTGIFLYSESTDQLLTIPKEYMNFSGLISEVESIVHLASITLEPGQSVPDYLKFHLEKTSEST